MSERVVGSNEGAEDAQDPPGPLPTPTLPKGGGAIRGIGEKFAVSPVTGTGSLGVPIATSPGRAGFGPQLALSYDSGAGNGPFGLGWRVAVPAITRKTDKGLPRYLDAEESDVFLLAGAEDLVPVLDDRGTRIVTPRTLHGIRYDVRLYRPRIEGLFARIERWTAVETGISHFRIITRDNVTTLYGFDDDSRIANPDDPRAVFSYLICRTFDDKGNVTRYGYVADDARGIDPASAHEVNRTDAVRGTQRYLKEILYGNLVPYFADWSETGAEPPLPVDWHFHLVLDYGDHTKDVPTPTRDRVWPVRPDPFSSHRAGFEVRTYRRCERILMFHSFEREQDVGADCLVRSTDLRYRDQDAPTDPRNPIYSCLTAITHTGYRRQGHGYLARSMPPLELEYTDAQIRPELFQLDTDVVANLPEGIDGSRYRWVDLDGEALSGVLQDVGGAWTYKRNLSALEARPQFAPVHDVARVPSRNDLRSQRLLDLSGDGQLDLVQLDAPAPGFFERTEDRSWSPFRSFASLPELPWSQPNVRLVDLTGDGLADALLTEDGVFTFWPSLGARGFSEAQRVPTAWDEERGPAVVLADGSETIFLADMTGDGLSDVVRVRNGDVCYWPNQGYGRFGAKVAMDGAPRFVDEARFDPRRVRLADIDGSGTTDLLYVSDDGVYVCFNQSGNAWAPAQRIAVFPGSDNLSSVEVLDLLGTGTACLVWSSPLASQAGSPVRYVDLMGGQKPHLMVRSRNNMGAETRVRYAPSTRFYLADELGGRPWITRLPHVVHVVERVETFDFIGRSRFVSSYVYRHGYFDGYEREFRGFGMVEQRDTEEHRDDTEFPELDDTNWDASSWAPPVVTKTWFHTGAYLDASAISKQYAHEYWVEPTPGAAAMQVPDSVIVSDVPLDAYERQEAYRALKGLPLRIETYGEDGTAQAANPYSITEQNFTVTRAQSRGPNQNAVFFTHPREMIEFHYERQAADPRVTHAVTLECDPFGNVKRSVAIGYPRRAGYAEPEPALDATFRQMLAYDQTRLHVVATESRYTNDFADPTRSPDVHRTPLVSETVKAEWTGIAPAATTAGITNLFTFDELDTRWSSLANDIPYENIPASDVDGNGTPATSPTRRITGRTRALYRKDDLSALCPPDQIESMALPGESYQLAMTAGVVTRVLGSRIADTDLAKDGGYVHIGDDAWWIPSGRIEYADGAANELAEARAHFYLPRRAIDPFGAISHAAYAYDLLPSSSVDALGNATQVLNDYRVLQPRQVTDANGNRIEVAFDALGLAVGTAVMGKETESLGDSLTGFVADLDPAVVLAHLADPLADPASVLGTATTRLVYDLAAYQRTGAPIVVYTLARETHVSELASGQTTRYQHGLAYSDGLGRVIQNKAQAEPGPLVEGGPDATPRWVGSGWTILNNKGNPVRRYEPFFSATHEFEFARVVGVSSVLLYDSADRVVATIHPNSTWDKVVFDAWHQETWDANDTALIADPRTDLDVGHRFKRLLGDAPDAWTSWYTRRAGGALGADEQNAATRTEPHAGTRAVTHFDALGRVCLAIADNGADGRYATRTALDTAGKPLAVFDSRGRRVFEYCVREPSGGGFRYVGGYDLTGRSMYRNGMDGGERRVLADIRGRQIRAWDALGRAFELTYDLLRRPTHRYVTVGAAAKILLERTLYGEGMPAQNLCGRIYRHYDTAGLASNGRYDFKGNLVESSRQLAREYRSAVNWMPLALLTDPVAIETAAKPMLIDGDLFTATSNFDALNRPIQIVTPHSATMQPNVVRSAYNEANLLERVDVWLQQAATPTSLLDPATADLHAIKSTEHNARGQQTAVDFGNGTTTTREYDRETFRLLRLTTTRPTSFSPDERVVQDLSYVYDPVGNVTHIQDDADIHDVIYFQNRRVEPSNDYVYDAIYRLTSATGREHLGQTNDKLNPPQQIADDDSFRTGILNPSDGKAMGTYTETYSYDAVGNILALTHAVASGTWTRHYSYAEPSQLAPLETNNRLSATSIPGDADDGPYHATYDHDLHGNMTRMPHLPRMTWDELDQLRSTTQQVVNDRTPATTFYTYDSQSQRHRKVTDNDAPAGETGTRTAERIYLGIVELYREYEADGTTVKLERETLHVMAGQERAVLVETRTHGTDKGSAQLVRYQHGTHLGSAAVELGDASQLISYEEYFPYGSTAYQAVTSQTETSKRYRYTGKERDIETALTYHGARYCAPWLGRWTATDPAGMVDGTNLFAYARNRPTAFYDPSGLVAATREELLAASENITAGVNRASAKLGKGIADQDHFPTEKWMIDEALDNGLSVEQYVRAVKGSDKLFGHVDSAINQARQDVRYSEWLSKPLPNSRPSVQQVRASITEQQANQLVEYESAAIDQYSEKVQAVKRDINSVHEYSYEELAEAAKSRSVLPERPLNPAEKERLANANDEAGENANRRPPRPARPKNGNVKEAPAAEVDGNTKSVAEPAAEVDGNTKPAAEPAAEPVAAKPVVEAPVNTTVDPVTVPVEPVPAGGKITVGGAVGVGVTIVTAAPTAIQLARVADNATRGTAEEQHKKTVSAWGLTLWIGFVAGVSLVNFPLGLGLGFLTAPDHGR